MANAFHHVAARALLHLNHADCQTACYRGLKSYNNQRFHDDLAWPQTIPALEELSQAPPQNRPLR